MTANTIDLDLYVDAADLSAIAEFMNNPLVKGFTTNPTLMNRAGVKNYAAFAFEAAQLVSPFPLSLEVFADDEQEIYDQAIDISKVSPNVFVKVPVTNTKGQSLEKTIHKLANNGVKINVTALMTIDQVERVSNALISGVDAIISVFAGRIADTGTNPIPIMKRSSEITHTKVGHKLLWASPREILNLIQAQESNCDIITMTPDLWKKLPMLGKDLTDLSLETVQMFYNDATAAGYSL